VLGTWFGGALIRGEVPKKRKGKGSLKGWQQQKKTGPSQTYDWVGFSGVKRELRKKNSTTLRCKPGLFYLLRVQPGVGLPRTRKEPKEKRV